jgi:DNA polymerase-4
VVPFEAAKSVGSEETFATDIDDPTQLAREVLRSCVRVGRRLREAGLAGRTVTLKLRFADFRTITRGRTLAVATDTDTELHEVARELLARLQLGRTPTEASLAEVEAARGSPVPRQSLAAPVRLVGVTVSNLQRQGAPVQLRLGPERPGWEAAVRAADAVRARFGDDAIDLASLTGDRPAEAYQEARQTPRPGRDPLLAPEEEP